MEFHVVVLAGDEKNVQLRYYLADQYRRAK